ncbi:MAG: CHAP domain-containing protein [Eubacterium sp.]|nr:CHAP domain-containing protein [Eubacterium sp.]
MKKHIKILSVILALIIALSPAALTASAATQAQLKSKVLSVAQNEVGYQGTRSYSKYGEWYGWQGAWCTTFVLWCFNKAGESMGVKLYANIIPSGGNCNSMISWFKNKGRYHTKSSGYVPKKGDLVFFDWSGNGSAQHVGIVKSASGGTVYTIEGNNRSMVRECTYSGSSSTYTSIRSIMGYGNPDWASVADGKKSKTKKAKKKKKKKTTTKKQTTKKKATKKKSSNKKTTQKKTTTTTKKETTTEKTTKKTTTTTTKPVAVAKDMKLHTATTDLQIGDSVQLDYTIEPRDAQAVVGYFCDEENIIDISHGGVITATGEGVATVVVCANDEIYRQVDFTVSSVSSKVTKHTPDTPLDTFEPTTELSEQTLEQKLLGIGINFEKLKSHIKYYIIPAYILGLTAALSLLILAIKAISKAIRKKKSIKDDGESDDGNNAEIFEDETEIEE